MRKTKTLITLSGHCFDWLGFSTHLDCRVSKSNFSKKKFLDNHNHKNCWPEYQVFHLRFSLYNQRLVGYHIYYGYYVLFQNLKNIRIIKWRSIIPYQHSNFIRIIEYFLKIQTFYCYNIFISIWLFDFRPFFGRFIVLWGCNINFSTSLT